ncbi:MAG TPA: MT-A70 family methyltransferase [Gemmataceae bacterium]|jgi:N6-adenosine-specific RNA methylase IME4
MNYQLLDPLRPEEYAALEADIRQRGVLIPVERDENGDLLDGHHRTEIAERLGIPCPEIVRSFATQQEKREHVIKINLARRHFDAIRWGRAFALLLEERGIPIGKGKVNQHTRASATVAEAAAEVGVPERTARARVAQARKYDEIKSVAESAPDNEDLQKLVEQMDLTGKVNGTYKQFKKLQAVAQIAAEPPPLPDGPFRVIVIDPPWHYEKRSEDVSQRGAIPYPSMSLDEIAALPIASMAAEDGTLWLWTTNAHLFDCPQLLSAWGFTHKTVLTWGKDRMGCGDWLRGQTEHCILAVRGQPVVELTNQTTLLTAPVREHSRKPEEFYQLVEALCPGSKVELFQRAPRLGWIGHGNEMTRFAS